MIDTCSGQKPSERHFPVGTVLVGECVDEIDDSTRVATYHNRKLDSTDFGAKNNAPIQERKRDVKADSKSSEAYQTIEERYANDVNTA